ncbi:MAG: hypothetical protein AAB444_01630 [Patescibacteria group bacterium]
MPVAPNSIEADREQRLARARHSQASSPPPIGAPLTMDPQQSQRPSGGQTGAQGSAQNETDSPSAMERVGNAIPGDSTAKAAGAAMGSATEIMQAVREQGIPAAMQKIGASYLQITALGIKEVGKKTLGSDLGLLFFIGANLQLLLLLGGKSIKKLPMELWELILILFLDIVILFLILTVVGFLSGMVSYVKQHQGDALWGIFFGPLDLIKNIIP